MEALLLLHGAIGSSAQLAELKKHLEKDFVVYSFDFSGHGHDVSNPDVFSIPVFADDVLRFMARNGLEKVAIFGYSMGGYVGMYLAKHQPEKVSRLVTLATKFEWNEEIANKEMKMLDPAKIEQKLPAFAARLENRHVAGGWKTVLDKTAAMMLELGANNPLTLDDYKTITIPTLLLLGDRDKMITLAETVAVYQSLSNGQMGMLPGTPHPIEQVNILQLSTFIAAYLSR